VYIETSYPRLNHDKARLVSPDLDSSSNCLEFYYHMLGDHVDTLNVYLRSNSGDELIWTLSKNQSDAWKKAQVPLLSSDSQFQVRSLEASTVTYIIKYVLCNVD
jgi:hypothetical protein